MASRCEVTTVGGASVLYITSSDVYQLQPTSSEPYAIALRGSFPSSYSFSAFFRDPSDSQYAFATSVYGISRPGKMLVRLRAESFSGVSFATPSPTVGLQQYFPWQIRSVSTPNNDSSAFLYVLAFRKRSDGNVVQVVNVFSRSDTTGEVIFLQVRGGLS